MNSSDLCKTAQIRAVCDFITPGIDEHGKMKLVIIPETIEGKKPFLSESVKNDMANIPHNHIGGTATCSDYEKSKECDLYPGRIYGRSISLYSAELFADSGVCYDCRECLRRKKT